MSDLGYFAVFTLILLLMGGVSGWMVWYSRRAMKAHKTKIEEMIEEMRAVIDEDEGDGKTPES